MKAQALTRLAPPSDLQSVSSSPAEDVTSAAAGAAVLAAIPTPANPANAPAAPAACPDIIQLCHVSEIPCHLHEPANQAPDPVQPVHLVWHPEDAKSDATQALGQG